MNNKCWERSRSKETCTRLVGVHLRNYLKMPLETFWHYLVKPRLKALKNPCLAACPRKPYRGLLEPDPEQNLVLANLMLKLHSWPQQGIKKCPWGCRDGSVKSIECSSTRPEFKSQQAHGGSQPSVMGSNALFWCV